MAATDRFHLAQVNIALPRAPLDSPALAEFVELLAPINALADDSPGFVWRLQTEDGNATAVRAFDNDRLIVNMSLWASLEALGGFVYRSAHSSVMRRRREWFEKMPELFTALWWIPAGTLPTVSDAERRLDHLRRRGPSTEAFTFKDPFPSPGRDDDAQRAPDDRWRVPADRAARSFTSSKNFSRRGRVDDSEWGQGSSGGFGKVRTARPT